MSLNNSFSDKINERRQRRDAEESSTAHSEEPALRRCLLVVDDEPAIVQSVSGLLDSEYEVITATSAEEALSLLRTRPVAVILTDQRMPGGNGAELLARSLDLTPETTRILFTGYSDISAVIDAVNEGQVYRYITKPWRPDELMSVVAQGVERYELVLENRRLINELTESNEQLSSMNTSLSDANKELEIAIRAKNDFLASMSHELRTPLNSIIGFSGTLLQGLAGDLNDEQRTQLQMINKSGNHLLTLVQETLDLARLESGHSELSVEDVAPGSLVQEVCAVVRPLAEVKGIQLMCSYDDAMLPLRTDGRFVSRILLSILGNAVKFTDVGSIRVTVAQNASGTLFTVEDTGCGIALDELDDIFEDYYQGTPHRAAKNAGSGLGLAVSRRLADAIDGHIEVKSVEGQGSVFTLRIPPESD